MKAKNLTFEYVSFDGLKRVSPDIPRIIFKLNFSDNKDLVMSTEKFTVPASASDFSLPVSANNNVKACVLYDNAGKTTRNGGTLSAKFNGATDANDVRSIKPRVLFSEDITQIDVSNSDTLLDKDLFVYKFFEVDQIS